MLWKRINWWRRHRLLTSKNVWRKTCFSWRDWNQKLLNWSKLKLPRRIPSIYLYKLNSLLFSPLCFMCFRNCSIIIRKEFCLWPLLPIDSCFLLLNSSTKSEILLQGFCSQLSTCNCLVLPSYKFTFLLWIVIC